MDAEVVNRKVKELLAEKLITLKYLVERKNIINLLKTTQSGVGMLGSEIEGIIVSINEIKGFLANINSEVIKIDPRNITDDTFRFQKKEKSLKKKQLETMTEPGEEYRKYIKSIKNKIIDTMNKKIYNLDYFVNIIKNIIIRINNNNVKIYSSNYNIIESIKNNIKSYLYKINIYIKNKILDSTSINKTIKDACDKAKNEAYKISTVTITDDVNKQITDFKLMYTPKYSEIFNINFNPTKDNLQFIISTLNTYAIELEDIIKQATL
jgi:hypothetical protein